MSPDELQEWFDSAPWQTAVTMPTMPHQYSLKRRQDPRIFERVVLTIWERGYDRMYLGRPWRSLDVDEDYYIWVCTRPEPDMPPPIEPTILINRAAIVQPELF